tara:strand:+ start:16939 stop:17535 length:597 start_codon:yes stop_codon:yes gene_type:complete
MQKIVCIYNYDTGNYSSIENALKKLDCKIHISNDSKVLDKANYIIFPGVGSFPVAMKKLKKNNFKDNLKKIIKKNIPILGICLGMQILADFSEEIKPTKGLAIIPGVIRKNKQNKTNVGWNKIHFTSKKSKFFGLNKEYFYFLHNFSYQGSSKFIKATTNKKNNIAAIIEKNNVVGVQFHPEKSQSAGLNFLKIFLGI